MTIPVLLVIPCFRESSRIPQFLDSLHLEFAVDETVSVVIVEDGGGAVEQAKMRALVDEYRARWPSLRPMMALEENAGKGGAIYAAWASTTDCPLLAFVDADGSCPAYEVKRILDIARSQPDAAFFASRVRMLGKQIDRDFHRHLMGRVYATIVSEMLSILVYDSQCGLKVVPAEAFAKIHAQTQVPGFAFDVELLCLLLDSGCTVKEVPIDWHETPGGKVHLIRDSVRMFRDVLSIRRRRRSVEWKSVCSNCHSL